MPIGSSAIRSRNNATGTTRRDADAWAEHYGMQFREPPARDFDCKSPVREATAAKLLGAAAS